MLSLVPIDLTGGYNPSRFPFANNQGLYNWYVINDKDESILVPTPGYKLIQSIVASGNARAIFRVPSLNQVVVVIGDTVYLLTNLSYTIIGTLETTNGVVTIASGYTETSTEIGFCDGVAIYTYLTSDASFEKASIDFLPQCISFQDTYFLATAQSTNRLYISNNNNGRVWDANDFTTVDNTTVAVLSYQEKVYVYGQAKVYIFYNTGNASFPYQQDILRSFSYGLLTLSALSSGFGLMVWLGINNESSPVILSSDGGQPTPVSTEGIDHLINNLTHPEQCDSFMYQEDGHVFYQINWYNPKDNVSLLYDFTAQRLTRVGDKTFGVHPIKGIARSNNTQFAINRTSGNIFEFSVNYFTNDGVVTPRMVISKNLSSQEMGADAPANRQITTQVFTVDADQGTQSEEVKLELALSHDHGNNFRRVKEKTFSNIGFTNALMNFYYLGTSKFWTFKLTTWSAGKVVLKGRAWAEVVMS